MSLSGSTPRRQEDPQSREPRWATSFAARVGPAFERAGQSSERQVGEGMTAIRRAVIQPEDERTFAGALF